MVGGLNNDRKNISDMTSSEILAAIHRAMEETWRRIDEAKQEQKPESREAERPNGLTPSAELPLVPREP